MLICSSIDSRLEFILVDIVPVGECGKLLVDMSSSLVVQAIESLQHGDNAQQRRSATYRYDSSSLRIRGSLSRAVHSVRIPTRFKKNLMDGLLLLQRV